MLQSLIHEAKAGDPLCPVTVLVTTGTAGLSTRRALAGQGRGVVNVNFVTVHGLAAAIANSALTSEGRLPINSAVLRGAIHLVLSRSQWPRFSEAREHASTVEAIAASYRELRSASDHELRALARTSQRAGDMVALVGAIRDETARWFDRADLFNYAGASLESTDRPDVDAQWGSFILYLPGTLEPAALRFLHALRQCHPTSVVLGLTGDPAVDEGNEQIAATLGHRPASVGVGAADRRPASAVLSAPTAEAEVHLVLRALMERCTAGVPLERMAIIHSGDDLYAGMVPQMLRQAGIPHNGPLIRPLSGTVAGRILLGVLGLSDLRWDRQRVMAWLATGPLVHRGRPVPASRWDVLSARAGVDEGLAGWRQHLTALVDHLRSEADRGNPDLVNEEAWSAVRRSEAEECDRLCEYVEATASALDAAPTEWVRWVPWAKRWLRTLIGGDQVVDEWPVEERAALDAVMESLDQIALLRHLDLPCTLASARAALEAQLSAPAPQTSRFGAGVWVGPLTGAAGLSFDALFVVGLNDGHFPGRPAEDVMVPDRDRLAVASRTIPVRADRAEHLRAAFARVLAASTSVHLSYRRGCTRDGKELRPSRWALDAIADLSGVDRRLYANEVDGLGAVPGFRMVPSFTAAVAAAGEPVDLLDHDLRSLLSWVASGRQVADHPLCLSDHTLSRGMAMIEGRRGGFTRYEGRVGDAVSRFGRAATVFSATTLERFAQCPRRYFFDSILGVEPRPSDERLLRADGAAVGSLVHRILERFVRPQIGIDPASTPDGPFAPERLLAIAEEEMAAFEAEGLAGPPNAWVVERARLRRTLRQFAEVDRRWRQLHGITTVAVEMPFGLDGSPEVELSDSRRVPVRFRGVIDRVDRSVDGQLVVTDYKTGRAGSILSGENPLAGGRMLQLPVYAAAVGAGAGRPVQADLWFVNEREGMRRLGYAVGPEELESAAQVVGALADALSSGQFPAHPDDGGHPGPCSTCPFDGVCPRDRARAWQQVRADPALSGYTELAA
jgi:RecB family exonuclease